MKNSNIPTLLKFLIKLAKHGLSYSFKCGPRSISKITVILCQLRCYLYQYRALFFPNKCIIFAKFKDFFANPSN